MKIFNHNNGWATKVNFIDENNILLGYDMAQNCCEYAGWFIDSVVHTEMSYDKLDELEATSSKIKDNELPGYYFEQDFIRHLSWDCLDEGGAVMFKLSKGDDVKYLYIFNCHNGYYGHGFTFSKTLTIEDGCL